MELLLFLAGLVGRHPPCSQHNCRCLSGPEEIELTLLRGGESAKAFEAGRKRVSSIHKVAFLLSFGVFPLENGTVTCINKLLIFMRGIRPEYLFGISICSADFVDHKSNCV